MTTARTKYTTVFCSSSCGWLMMIVGHETKVKVKVSIYFCLDDDDHWTVVAQAATAQQRSSTLANIFIGSSSSRPSAEKPTKTSIDPSTHPLTCCYRRRRRLQLHTPPNSLTHRAITISTQCVYYRTISSSNIYLWWLSMQQQEEKKKKS